LRGARHGHPSGSICADSKAPTRIGARAPPRRNPDPAGNRSLATPGTAGGATFNGRINPNGNINGLWRFMNGANGGTFGGRRS